ncbi:MAG: hypothetical protein ABW182_01220 [Sphingomonas sp.]
MKTPLLAAALASLVAGGSAYALVQPAAPSSGPTAATPQDTPQPGRGRGGMLMRADSNGDGVITREEFIAASDARFARMDVEKDGKLTAAERQGRRGGGRMGAALDHNGDGFVTLDEQRAQAARSFDRLDRNKDGQIDSSEIAAMRDAAGGLRGSDATPPAGDADATPGA